MVTKLVTFIACLVIVLEWEVNGNYYGKQMDFVT